MSVPVHYALAILVQSNPSHPELDSLFTMRNPFPPSIYSGRNTVHTTICAGMILMYAITIEGSRAPTLTSTANARAPHIGVSTFLKSWTVHVATQAPALSDFD